MIYISNPSARTSAHTCPQGNITALSRQTLGIQRRLISTPHNKPSVRTSNLRFSHLMKAIQPSTTSSTHMNSPMDISLNLRMSPSGTHSHSHSQTITPSPLTPHETSTLTCTAVCFPHIDRYPTSRHQNPHPVCISSRPCIGHNHSSSPGASLPPTQRTESPPTTTLPIAHTENTPSREPTPNPQSSVKASPDLSEIRRSKARAAQHTRSHRFLCCNCQTRPPAQAPTTCVRSGLPMHPGCVQTGTQPPVCQSCDSCILDIHDDL